MAEVIPITVGRAVAEVIPIIWIILDPVDVPVRKDITIVSETKFREDQLENRDGKYESIFARSVGKMSGGDERNTLG